MKNKLLIAGGILTVIFLATRKATATTLEDTAVNTPPSSTRNPTRTQLAGPTVSPFSIYDLEEGLNDYSFKINLHTNGY